MSGEPGTWVGMLDLDGDETVAALSCPISDQHVDARILVRKHEAPIGYVTLPAQPPSTLAKRTRQAAESNLAQALDRHVGCDSSQALEFGAQDWIDRVCCPRRHPASSGQGLSVVVCTRDRPAMLRECLRALQRASYSPLEILVIDNAPSGDETKLLVDSIARADSRISYACETKPGLSNARNRGLSEAKFDLVAFTDDDALVDPGWPSALIAGFTADARAACITGMISARSLESSAERYYDSRYLYGEAFTPRVYDLEVHRDSSPLYPFNAGIFGGGVNFAVRREAVQAIGGFDALLGAGGPSRGGEDLDIFVRIVLAGSRICYLPSALVWHQHRADERELAAQVYAYGHGLGAYLAKRLIRREMSLRALLRNFSSSKHIARRMRKASASSKLSGRRRLAVSEVLGVFVGAFCYWRLSLR